MNKMARKARCIDGWMIIALLALLLVTFPGFRSVRVGDDIVCWLVALVSPTSR